MASFVNGCVFTATSAGTGSFVVSAAVTGWQTPAQASAVNAASYRYRAFSADNTQWEIGTGVYTTGDVTLTRAVIAASSNAGAAVNFTTAPSVALTLFGTDFVNTGTLGSGVATFLATPSSANLASAMTDETGSGVLVFATSPALVTPDLGTPTALLLTNATGLPISTGVAGLGAGVATWLATPSSANLATAVTDETGSGALVFATSPSFTTDIRPVSNDGAALGISGTAFSDLFLASGGVINWNAGDVTLTHSAGELALTGSATDVVLDLGAANAGQIEFPATQNASANANTLDDYEEGTFTPAITFTTPGNLSITYGTQSGVYTKIGRMVHIQIQLSTSAFTHTTASGSLEITGLPFAISGTAAMPLALFAGITKTNYTQFGAALNNGVSIITINASGSGQSASTVVVADVPSGGSVLLRITAVYTAA